MTWNHRIMAHEHKGDVYFEIHEVYYNESGVPDGYTEKSVPVASDTIKGIKWTLKKMKKCVKEPILYAGEKFPNEYKNRL